MGYNLFMLFLTPLHRPDLTLTHTRTADMAFFNDFNSTSAAFTSAPNQFKLMEERYGLAKNHH